MPSVLDGGSKKELVPTNCFFLKMVLSKTNSDKSLDENSKLNTRLTAEIVPTGSAL